MMINLSHTLQQQAQQIGFSAFTASDYQIGLIKHIVLFRYQPQVSDSEQKLVLNRFLALKQSTRAGKPYIMDIIAGQQISGEAADGGFQQAFIVTFQSQGDRNFYVGEPIVTDSRYYDAQHAEFKQFVYPYLANDGVLVFDFAV